MVAARPWGVQPFAARLQLRLSRDLDGRLARDVKAALIYCTHGGEMTAWPDAVSATKAGCVRAGRCTTVASFVAVKAACNLKMQPIQSLLVIVLLRTR